MAQSSAPRFSTEYAAQHAPVGQFNHAVTEELGKHWKSAPGGFAEVCMMFHCNPRQQRNPVSDAYGLHRSWRTGCGMWQDSCQHLRLLLRKEVCDADGNCSNQR